MEFEYYPHQQQSQHQQQQQSQKQQEQVQQQQTIETMATGSEEVDSSGSPAAAAVAVGTASTTGIINSNNNNITNNNNISINNNSSNSSNTNHSFLNNSNLTSVATADAATVAIAEDMLSLHHGTALHNNCNSNSSSASNHFMEPAVSDSPPIGMNTPPDHASLNDHNIINADNSPTNPPDNAVGTLKFEQELLYITETCTVIGRNSSTSNVHFHVAENNLVSRKHFQVIYDPDSRDFWVQCLSKNGIFVDDFLQRRNADPLKLPQRCFFRFPSTEIRIQFQSFVHGSESNHRPSGGGLIRSNVSRALINNHYQPSSVQNAHVVVATSMPDGTLSHQHENMGMHQHNIMSSISSSGSNNPSHLYPMDSYAYPPLKISIPKKDQKSPYLSPTGTISAANSCPASPRQGFHQNQSNYNNYSNNNLQNDLFQTPSTVNYNQNEKPPYSYAQLIVQAISAAPDKQLTLSGIYSFIIKHYPYYRKETNKGWQNSIRHNLSLNRYFIKVARSQDEPGKGSFWRIDPDSGAKLIDHSYKKRRQRSNQSFRPSLGMPRSAPVSPSHIDNFADNSRESSPTQDIVSAPGSPGMSLENRAVEVDLMYNPQNIHQQNSSNNSQNNHYNSSGSPYYVSNQNPVVVCMQSGQQQQPHSETGAGGGGVNSNNNGNGVGALIALKRNHAMLANTSIAHQQQLQHQQQQLHPDIIYEEIPTDYSGNMESGDDECDSAKRPKYMSEVL